MNHDIRCAKQERVVDFAAPRGCYRTCRQGFTLIELLVAIAIFGFITTAVVVNLRSGEYASELRLSALAIADQARVAQTMTQSGRAIERCTADGCASEVSPGGYGVRITRDGMVSFADANRSRAYDSGEEIADAQFALPQRVNIRAVLPADPLDVIFAPPDGAVWIGACNPDAAERGCPGMAQITLGHEQIPQLRTVRIYRISGRIEVE